MGIYDSTRTRVVPVFSRLYAIDPTGRNWLPKLLDLVSDSEKRQQSQLGVLKQAKWWPYEKKLHAPKSLLKWLVKNIEEPRPLSEWGKSKETILKRNQLVDHDRETIKEALNLIDKNYKIKAWYVLEGPSSPDVFLQTTDAVIVIEGKRTEEEPKTYTTWMENRHQMIRHLDCAYELYKNRKQLYGLMIVESENRETVPDKWLQYKDQIISDPVLNESLPHRSEKELQLIRDSFLGITTWQRVCAELNIPFEVLIPTVVDIKK